MNKSIMKLEIDPLIFSVSTKSAAKIRFSRTILYDEDCVVFGRVGEHRTSES